MSTLKSGMWPRKKVRPWVAAHVVTLVVRQREGGSQVSRGEFVGLTKQRVLLTLQCKFNSVRLREFRLEVPRNLKERNTAVW